MPLAGQVAIVTGAGGALGSRIATALAAAGASVALNHHPDDLGAVTDTVAAIDATGGNAVAVPGDVADEHDVAAMVANVVDAIGPPSILVNNAAVSVAAQYDWRTLSSANWHDVFSVNVVGAFLCARAVHASMAAAGRGSIVNIASVTPLLGRTGNLAYVTSKAAIIGMTRSLAREVGGDGIRVNAVAPGAIRTEAEAVYGNEEEVAATMLPLQAMQRRGVPDDVASVVRFLASDDASFVTGQLLVVDGGWVMS